MVSRWVSRAAALAALVLAPAADARTFAGFAGFGDCQGCRSDDCCLALTELEAAETVVVRAGCV